jgi:predicted AAA+ superfamily ATPase
VRELAEFKQYQHLSEIREKDIDELLVFGGYPEILSGKAENKFEYITELASNFIYKDISGYEEIRQPEILRNLLELLAFQIGNEVSYNELATKLGVRRETVERYIYILEEAFVIFRLYPFSRNLRNEIGKKVKIYFYDLGIRNGIIDNLKSLKDRNDVGRLWENFCIIERIKKIQEDGLYRNIYFWRTTDKKEIDYIEEYDGALYGYEFKWGIHNFKIPKQFLDGYPGSSAMIINPSNFMEWLK